MEQNEIFIISSSINGLDTNTEDGFICNGIYTDLEKAKNELKKIVTQASDFFIFTYRICIYSLNGNEYQNTNKMYIYDFGEFIYFEKNEL